MLKFSSVKFQTIFFSHSTYFLNYVHAQFFVPSKDTDWDQWLRNSIKAHCAQPP